MRVLRAIVVALVVIFLLAPLVVIAVGSVNVNRYLNFPPEGFSLSWYAQLFTDSGWQTSIRYSVTIATASPALAVVIATPLAYVLRAYRIRLTPLLYTLGILPFMLPPIISAHGIFFSTLPLVTISLAMETMDQALPEAARTLGADDRTTFRTVTLPLLIPSMVTGYAAAFVLSLNEYIISFLVAGFTVETLPVKIVNSL